MAPLSRYTFDLQTDHTRPESYYDQICALSEQTINKNFEKLFEQRKDDITQLKYYKGDISDGKVMAVLNPPVITLKFDDVDAKMLFRLSFKSGYVIVGKGERNQINLSGWEIAVPANLSTMVVNPPEAENLSKQERKLANNSFHELQKTYEFHATATPEEQRPSNDKSPPRRMMKPGEYSIHRLFAAINVSNDNVWAPTSDSDWGLPDMQASSVPGPNGSRLSLQEWTEEAENRSRQASVMHVLRSWAADHRDSALFTLGLQIQLPEKEDSRTPSFIPTALRLQNYPYFTDAEIRDYKEPENFTVGEVGRLYNCFVYCEATDGRSLPKVKRLPFTGNLAEPNGPLGGDLGTGEINGSFVVSHHLYLESNLLKILRDLSRAIQVIPLTPECTVNDDKKDRFQPRFAFGSDPSEAWDKNRLPNSHVNRGDPLDAHFDWKPSPGGGYEWSDFVEAWGSKTEVYDFGAAGYQPGPFFRKWDINAKMSTKVSWVEGTSKILVSGRTEYFHWEGYNRSTPNFQASKNGSCQWGEFSTIVKWSFIINLRVPEDLQKDPTQYNGVIEPTLEGIDPKTFLPNDYNVDKSHMQYVLHNAHEPICNTINQQIAASISNINRAIKGKFASIGNFFYPGTQELIFGPPRLTKSGDIIATISYKDLPADRVSVRPPGRMKWEEPEVQKPETVIGDPTMDPDQFPSQTPLLTWTGSVDSYTPPSQPTEPSNGLITLRATNKTGRAIAFKRIKLSMIPTTNIGFPPTCLFIEDNLDEWKEWVNPETIIKDWEARRKARIDADREAAEAAKKAEDERKKAELDEERSKQQEKKEPVAGLEIPSADAPIKIIPDAEDSILTGKESNLSEKIQVPATATGENTGGVGDKFDSPKDPLVEKPDPEPLPPLPKATYLLKQHKVTAQGKMWVRLDGTDMVFEIMPMGSDGDINEGGKVILGRDAVLEIVLDGKVSLSGKYLLEIQEFWADPTDDDSRAFDEFPYAYVAVELNPSGNGTVKALDYNQAKEIQMKKE